MLKTYILSGVLLLGTAHLKAQDDLLAELESETTAEVFELPAFKGMRIASQQSTKLAAKGDLYFNIFHRFGTIKGGVEEFFGLDQASTTIEFVYGISDKVQLGISRESFKKTYTGSLKYKLAKQTQEFPLHLALYTTANVNTELNSDNIKNYQFSTRMSYGLQFLASRKINDKLSLQLSPTYIRENLVLNENYNHDQIALGIGGRYKLSKRFSVNLEYAYNFSRPENSVFKNPLTLGVDIETGGHVFQMMFSSAQSTSIPGHFSRSDGDWTEGNIFFGFNITRVF
ncbi:MAG: DUF5777 family beta-barrel protein [Flavobacteriales bacterium]|jgi:hypothetical protein|nr:DUF5777 family beta-barrel protein [Flavobacteriales bacterium]